MIDPLVNGESVIHVVMETEVVDGIEYLPGWYFWDETWADRHGPFATKEEAETSFQIYNGWM